MMLKQGDAVFTCRQGVGSALAPAGVFVGEDRRNLHTSFLAEHPRGREDLQKLRLPEREKPWNT